MTAQSADYLTLPDLMKAAKILCIQPHPDDLEIGAGATVASLTARGVAVTCLTVTDGSMGTDNPTLSRSELARIRKAETTEGAALLGVEDLRWLGYPDGGDLPYRELRAALTRVIRQVKPDALLTCDPWLPYEVHSDHIQTGMAAAEAAFLAPMPHFCPADLQEERLETHRPQMVAFYYTAYPNTIIDVSTTWNLKLEAIGKHCSQFKPDQLAQFTAYLSEKAEKLGREKNYRYSEGFKVLSPRHLHICEAAWQS